MLDIYICIHFYFHPTIDVGFWKNSEPINSASPSYPSAGCHMSWSGSQVLTSLATGLANTTTCMLGLLLRDVSYLT